LKLSALPFSRADVFSKNTFVENYSQEDCEELVKHRPRADSEWTGLLRLAAPESAAAVDEFQATTEVHSDIIVVTDLLEGGSAFVGGDYVWMTCCVRSGWSADGYSWTTEVMPCTSDEAIAAAQASGEAMQMWCWLQPDGQGSTFAIPCNDRPLHLIEKALTAAEAECAPQPAVGSYKPPWTPGEFPHICSPPTTLMLSNLPPSLTQEDLLEVLDRAEFSGFYDFVFLESDPITQRSCGTAIVNCTRHLYASALAAKFHGHASWPTNVDDDSTILSCEVQWSSIYLQGFDSLTEHYRDHSLNKTTVPEEMRPQFFKDGFAYTIPRSSPA
jgi:hypothetical protein